MIRQNYSVAAGAHVPVNLSGHERRALAQLKAIVQSMQQCAPADVAAMAAEHTSALAALDAYMVSVGQRDTSAYTAARAEAVAAIG